VLGRVSQVKQQRDSDLNTFLFDPNKSCLLLLTLSLYFITSNYVITIFELLGFNWTIWNI
jgi:hypothetical protein